MLYKAPSSVSVVQDPLEALQVPVLRVTSQQLELFILDPEKAERALTWGRYLRKFWHRKYFKWKPSHRVSNPMGAVHENSLQLSLPLHDIAEYTAVQGNILVPGRFFSMADERCSEVNWSTGVSADGTLYLKLSNDDAETVSLPCPEFWILERKRGICNDQG
jgi:hypothetical protein